MTIHQVLDANQFRKICLVLLKIKPLTTCVTGWAQCSVYTLLLYFPERGWMLQSSYLCLLQGGEIIYQIFQINFDYLLKRKW